MAVMFIHVVQGTIHAHEGFDNSMFGIWMFLTVVLMMLTREIRFRLNAIELTDNELVIRPLLGLLPATRIRYSEIMGYNAAIEESKTSDGQAVYIYQNNKRTIEISNAYYKDFSDFEKELRKKIKLLGWESVSISKIFMNSLGVPIKWSSEKD